MSHIFISYAHEDLDLANRIIEALAKNAVDAWINWKSIPKGEDWEQEIYRGIEEADAFLFLISPDSVASEMCTKEIAHAVKNGKRILPIVIRDTDPKIIHPEISKRNWIFCREGQDDFNKAVEETRETIHTDYEWLKYHTKLQIKALDWEREKDNSRLLRGKELREAEQRLAEVGTQEDPQPTKIQREYLLFSQRNEIRARRQITFGLSIGLVIMVVLSIFSWSQRNTAVAKENARATAQSNAEEQSKIALARQLASQAQLILNKKEDANAPLIASLLAIESMQRYPNANADETLRSGISLLTPTSKNIFTTHTQTINSITFSSDEKYIASSDYDGVVKIWDIKSGEEVASLSKSGAITKMEFSLDGELLFVGSDDGSVILLNVRKGFNTVLDSHGSGYVNLDINPVGNLLIAGGADGIIRIWDLNQYNLVRQLDQGSAIKTLKFTPDGTKIISSGDNNIIKVWNPVTGKEICRKFTNLFGAFSINISADSKQVISGGDDGVEIWDISTGKTSYMLDDATDYIGFFSPNDTLIATYRSFNNGSVAIWDANTKKQILRISLDFYISEMVFSYDSKYIILGSEDGSTYLWDIEAGREISRMLQNGRIYSVQLNPRGSIIATAGVDKTIHFWPFPYMDNSSVYPKNKLQDNFTLDPNGNWIVSWGQSSRSIEMIETSTSTSMFLIKTVSPVVSVAISPDEERLASLGEDNTVCIWGLKNAQKGICLTDSEIIKNIKFSSSSRWIAAQERQSIKIWDIQTGKEIANLIGDYVISTFAFSFDDQLVATGAGGDYKINVWDVANQQKVTEFQHDPTVNIGDLIFSKDGKWLISSSRDGSARVWDLETLKELSEIVYDQQEYINMYEVLKTRISPDEKKLLSVNTVAVFNINNDAVTARESTIRVWDPLSGKEFNRFIHNSWVNDIIWSPDGNYVFSGGWDGVVRMWDVNSGDEVGRINHNTPIETLAFTPDRSQIISISSDSIYRMSYWKPEDLINYACTRLTQNLSASEWAKYFGNTEYHTTCPNLPIPTE